jgi:alpha-ketoglutarate-dependent taurine dioxygenase
MGDRPDLTDGNRLMDYTIAPLSEHTGAEVRGIDLREQIDEVARARLNRAFVDHAVLVLRDQHLTPQQLLDAVGLFGEPFPQHNSRFALPGVRSSTTSQTGISIPTVGVTFPAKAFTPTTRTRLARQRPQFCMR